MIKVDLPPIVLDADPLLRRFGLPYWALARMREMRVGDQLLLVNFDAPDVVTRGHGHVAVTLTRERGGLFHIEAGWLAHLGRNAQRRGHLWSWAYFKILPHRKLELVQKGGAAGQDTRRRALQLVEVVMRRACALSRWAKRDGDRQAYAAMSPDFFMSRCATEVCALPWLEKLRGPALRAR